MPYLVPIAEPPEPHSWQRCSQPAHALAQGKFETAALRNALSLAPTSDDVTLMAPAPRAAAVESPAVDDNSAGAAAFRGQAWMSHGLHQQQQQHDPTSVCPFASLRKLAKAHQGSTVGRICNLGQDFVPIGMLYTRETMQNYTTNAILELFSPYCDRGGPSKASPGPDAVR